VTRAEEFEELRPLLSAIAYPILGSVSGAEDAVQETWLRLEASPTQPTSTKAFLSAVVTGISIDVLRSPSWTSRGAGWSGSGYPAAPTAVVLADREDRLSRDRRRR
jgi:DNA-directed RNA polymerase specialized sigma24 family protein